MGENRPAHKCLNADCNSGVSVDGECWRCTCCSEEDDKTIRVLLEAVNYYRNHVVYYESRGKVSSGEMSDGDFKCIQDRCRTSFNRFPEESDLRKEVEIVEKFCGEKMDSDELGKVLKIDPNYIEKTLKRGV